MYDQERIDETKRQMRERTGGSYCPRCGNTDLQITRIKGFFGTSSLAYRCFDCGYTWKWK